MALPLALVSRLEEIAPSRVERAGGRDVVQYRGGVMPLLWLVDERSRATRMTRERPLHVVVFSERGRSLGLVVDEISDVIEEEVQLQAQAGGADLLGVAVLAGRVTDLLDVRGLIERHEPGFFERRGAAA
jgi:two-component system chemotaxis sensor kinase CheA